MAQIDDLTPCDYFPLDGVALTAVGWLGSGSQYVRGAVSAAFRHKLNALCESPWQPLSCAGLHACELCQFDAPQFGDNLFIPHAGHIFVAPAGMRHYIAAHWYQPPAIFVEGVLACPPMRSHAYFKALLDNGGRPLVKAARG